MRILRKIFLFVSAAFALFDLLRTAKNLLTFHPLNACWSLLFAAGWAAVFIYLLRLEKNAAAPAAPGS